MITEAEINAAVVKNAYRFVRKVEDVWPDRDKYDQILHYATGLLELRMYPYSSGHHLSAIGDMSYAYSRMIDAFGQSNADMMVGKIIAVQDEMLN